MHAPSRVLSAASCRAARELLKLSQEELAALAGVSLHTLRRFEAAEGETSAYAIGQIMATLEREGILFVGPRREPALR